MATKSERQAVADHFPWKPAKFDNADAAAMQALAAGNASSMQQKRAITWIIDKCCATYDLSYRPGVEGDRDTVFAEGKRSVGLQLVKLIKVKIGLLRSEP